MHLSRVSGLASLAVLVSLAACGAPPGPGTATKPTAGRPDPAPVTAGAAKKHATVAERPAPPRITTPMAGEPTPTQIAETRLVPTACEAVSADDVAASIKAMRAEVDASFKSWHDGQPACWEEDRAEYRTRKDLESAGDTIGYGFGSGGLGLSGVGEGGGGRGVALASPPRAMSPPPQARSGAVSGRVAGLAASNEVAKATSASGTNNQVATVDEADIVKTDGRYVYLAANGALRIVEAMNPRMVSVTKLGGGAAREMFVEGDRAVVYTSSSGAAKRCTYGYDCQFAGDGSTTRVLVLDIKDRRAPKVVRTLELSGSLMAARRIGNAVHTVTSDRDLGGQKAYATWPANLGMCGTAEAKVRAQFAALKTENEQKIRVRAASSVFPSLVDNGVAQVTCGGDKKLLRTGIRDGEAFTSVMSFDLTDDRTAPTTATVQSRPGAVFASRDALYFSVVHQRSQAPGSRWYRSSYGSANEASEIHKFTIGDQPRLTRYSGSGMVPGHVLNQFSMDEWSGYLRVATTTGRVPDPAVSSTVSILASTDQGDLVRVGAAKDIAPGEDIRAVRFDGDRGYVVTFKKTDPLFVLDLYQPSKPSILGELKIPGFSTYMHRIDPEHLLSIGFDANDHGDFAYFDGVILQLFDVKNATDPKLLFKEKIGSRGSSSEAAADHLAFNYFGDRGLLAVPMTECSGGGDGQNGDHVAFSGLYVYDVDVDRGFKRLGGVDHASDTGAHAASCNTWWSNANSAVKRSVFLDDLVYSIASDRVKVQRMSRFGTDLASLSLME